MIGIYKWGWGDGSENLAFWGWADYLEPGDFVPVIVTGTSGCGTVASGWAPVAVTDSVIARLSAGNFEAKISHEVISAGTVIPEREIKSVKWTAIYACGQGGFAHYSAIRVDIPGKLEAKNEGVKISGRAEKAKAVKS